MYTRIVIFDGGKFFIYDNILCFYNILPFKVFMYSFKRKNISVFKKVENPNFIYSLDNLI